MPRHYFTFDEHVRDAVRRHVQRAIAGLNPRSFRQEPAYTSALAGRLVGIAYNGRDGRVEFESTVVADRGANSAEREFGADMAFTAKIAKGRKVIEKAILVQAKLGKIEDLSPTDLAKLKGQIKDMLAVTRAAKVMEIPEVDGRRVPRLISGEGIVDDRNYHSYELGNYIVDRILTTLDGDTRPRFVDAVRDSNLTQLRVVAEQYD